MVTKTPQIPPLNFNVDPALSPFNVPLKEYLATHDQHECAIASGALVFDSQDRVLLVQRAAHDSMPNRWEIPGGAVDHDDPSILHGVARELWEESGLKLKSFRKQVGDRHIWLSPHGLRIEKFTFEVEVQTTEGVKLDPNEHQEYVWASEEECRKGRLVWGGEGVETEIKFTTEPQKRTVLRAFRLRKEGKSGI